MRQPVVTIDSSGRQPVVVVQINRKIERYPCSTAREAKVLARMLGERLSVSI